ncbi:MAG: decaprenyl-phosphate phosphoribosyltransferase [Sciscionella sp.]
MSTTTERSTRPKVGAASRSVGFIAALRPRQWLKNVLVLAAVFAGGHLSEVPALVASAVAFVVFCMAASGNYLVNDVKDVEADRLHPTKRYRPIAAGRVLPKVAVSTAVVLLAAALGLSVLASWQLLVVVAIYITVQLAYCFGVKHLAVIEMCVVASGFLMRAIAGGAATGIPLSQWFYLITAFGSLFMVAGKRYAEHMVAEREQAEIRKSLKGYSASYLRFVWAMSAGVMVTAYGLWAFDIRSQFGSMWAVVSIAPFVMAMLRYAMDVDSGNAGEPEKALLRDRTLLVLGLAWVVFIGLAVYLR